MLLGYNTNSLAHHDPFQAVELLADLGYQSIALTLDHGPLNPFAADLPAHLARMKQLLRARGLKSVIETGARFLLDPRAKHEPTLVSTETAGRQKRIDFLRRAIDVAAELESGCVSLWSGGVHDSAADSEAWRRLTEGLGEVAAHAKRRGVTIGFEPEPGMLVDTMDAFDRLSRLIDDPAFQLTLDIGHLHCQGETPISDLIRRWGPRIVNVHLEDMRSGVHEHLMFGEGELDFPPILAALAEVGYRGGVHVELSRHSHEGPQAARRARDFLRPLMPRA